MSESLRQARLQKLQNWQANNENPYPTQYERTHSCAAAGELNEGTKNVKVGGRIVFERGFGKMAFLKLRDRSGDLQVMLKVDELGEERFNFVTKNLDLGDIVGTEGEIILTKTGEKTLLASAIALLSKSLAPLPDKWHGIKDEDEIYRKRYLDFLLNPESREKVLLISKIANATRQFLGENDFVEVQTPILENNPSGAAARPFATHLNAFDEDVFLRICMGELWQKKMMIGSFEKTFEIGKAFRNEGVDWSHNPEFTMCEYYWAYADRDQQVDFFEQLLWHILDEVKGARKFEYKGKELDFTKIPRVTFAELIEKETGIKILDFDNAADLKKEMQEKVPQVDVSTISDLMALQDELWKKTARAKIWNPVFVLDYPAAMKPLAKAHPDSPQLAHSAQLVVDGAELANMYSELNDPVLQARKFAEQKELEDQDEAFGSDEEFVEALEYGMPPVTGLGFGLDRLAMILGDAQTVREVTAFPFMKKGRKGASQKED